MVLTFQRMKQQIRHHLQEAEDNLAEASKILRYIEDEEIRDEYEKLFGQIGTDINKARDLAESL